MGTDIQCRELSYKAIRQRRELLDRDAELYDRTMKLCNKDGKLLEKVEWRLKTCGINWRTDFSFISDDIQLQIVVPSVLTGNVLIPCEYT